MARIKGVSKDSDVTVVMTLEVEDVPEVTSLFGQKIRPDRVRLTYQYIVTVDADGWANHQWMCREVEVSGFLAPAPGRYGNQRGEGASALWKNVPGQGLVPHHTRDEFPEWAMYLIQDMRPSGEVFLPWPTT